MKTLLISLDRGLKLMYLLFLFWGIYWLLEGGSRFLDPRGPGNQVADLAYWLELPSGFATSLSYIVGTLEVIIGLTFTVLLSLSSREQRGEGPGPDLFADRTLHRLAFKASILTFILFMPADLAIGATDQVFPHAVYLLLVLVTYDLWYRTDQFVQAELEGKAVSGSS